MRVGSLVICFIVGFSLSLFFALPAYPQTGVVTRPINLITHPANDDPPIRLLLPPETFRLVAPKENGGFFRVRLESGETGWVLKSLVSIYKRADWMKNWKDADGDCQDTRQEVLIRQSAVPLTFNPNVCRGTGEDRHCDCRVAAGLWVDPYGGGTFTDPSDIDIDHVVPLGNAHVSGGWAWPPERREAYANDLENLEHLLAVKDHLNQGKGDKSPDKWKPPRQEFWCEYATIWLKIKERWGLILTASEAAAVAEMKGTCAF